MIDRGTQTFLRVGLAFLLVVLFLLPAAHAADVDVYGEAAWTDSDVVVYLYADANAGPLCSFGVKITYPADLTLDSLN